MGIAQGDGDGDNEDGDEDDDDGNVSGSDEDEEEEVGDSSVGDAGDEGQDAEGENNIMEAESVSGEEDYVRAGVHDPYEDQLLSEYEAAYTPVNDGGDDENEFAFARTS